MTNDHNSDNLALQNRIGELEAVLIQRDDQLRELQQQLAARELEIQWIRDTYKAQPSS